MKARSAVSVVAGALLAALLAADPTSAEAPAVVAASADAYGYHHDVDATPIDVSSLAGPIARSSQDYPTATAAPGTAQVHEAGPEPSDASVLDHAGVLTSSATATGDPHAVAFAEVHDLSLLGPAGESRITADYVRAAADVSCAGTADASGATFANLRVDGHAVDQSPAPNTVIDLGVATVILNEQHPATDGHGIVVNAIHVVSTESAGPLARFDAVVAHAMSSVTCPMAPPAVAGESPVVLTVAVTPATAAPGDTVTFTVRATNTSTEPYLVNALVDHAPVAFDLVSTDGDFGSSLDVAPPAERPGGGLDVQVGQGATIPAGDTLTQRFVMVVREDAEPAVYASNVEVSGSSGTYLTGLSAPVAVVVERTAPVAPAAPAAAPADTSREDRGSLPATGPAETWPLLGTLLATAALAARRLCW